MPPDATSIKLLAEAAVRRGFLGREWLQRFLHAARYPFADKLLDALCPAPQVRPRPPRVYENLPAPTYSQFVMREQAFAEVSDGLGKRSAAVLIVGMGGNGKTSLAREVAAHCLRDDGETQQFDAVVWVSDKDRPGTTNLTTVLDEVARTLDYPGFTQFDHDEKRREVEQLLRRQRVLLVVDNFETITDGALLTWLLNLPEPSKALITTREYRREFRRSSWPVELRGMREEEVRTLIDQRLRQLRIAKLVGRLEKLEPLITATGGNPKAIEITLGLLKYERRPLQDLVDDLYAARGDLFDDLFSRAWALLDEAARRVLLVATFFPTSASGDALRATADVQGFAFDRAVERLADLALLDVQQADLSSPPRYALHPLVRAFAGARLAEQPTKEDDSRSRWLAWVINLSATVGDSWLDLPRLATLDSECETIHAAARWAFDRQCYAPALEIVLGASYYYYARGLWEQKADLDQIHFESAHALGNTSEEVRGLAYYVQMLSKQDQREQAIPYIARLRAVAEMIVLHEDVFYFMHNAIASYWIADSDLDAAWKEWQKSLVYARKRNPETYGTSHTYIANLSWIGFYHLWTGHLAEAQHLLLEVLEYAQHSASQRVVNFVQQNLARIHIELNQRDEAERYLTVCAQQAYIHQDREAMASIQRAYARLHTLRGDIPAARASLAEAIDRFERLGMRRELAEARQTLADLDTGAAVDAHPAA